MKYNEAQERAINTVDGQVMLISCPGSGKTSTMLRRIHHMTEVGINPENILMVTFTDAAAEEMKIRFIDEYGSCGVTFCTIHSLCLRLITESNGGDMPYHLMSSDEQYTLLKDSCAGIKLPSYVDRKSVLDDIGNFKNGGKKEDEFEPLSINKDMFFKIYHNYEKEKLNHGYMDFDDMLTRCKTLLEKNAGFRKECQKKYRYIICDEYQDTNPVQRDILYSLAGYDGNLCVVGDDDQSIYGFRGSDPKIMLDFPKDYYDCKRIQMDINYRSCEEIVSAAKNLIEYNRERFEKDICSDRGAGGKVEYLSYGTRTEELNDLLMKLDELDRQGISPNQISVLARTNQQLEDLASLFEKNNIKYTSNEHIASRYEHFIFKDIISYLRLINGDGERNDIMLIMNRPYRGFCERDYTKMKKFSPETFISYSGRSDKRLEEKAEKLCEDLSSLKNKKLSEQVSGIIYRLGYGDYITSFSKKLEQDEDILWDGLVYFMNDSEKYNSYKTWLKAAAGSVTKHNKEDNCAEGVLISTMHKAKGLEWNAVFLIDCCEGVTPYAKAKTPKDIEEERRLFYVAATRARDRLYVMNYTHKQVSATENKVIKPSRFINEMQSPLKHTSAEMERRKERERERMLSDFEEGTLQEFKVGDIVHHKDYGLGCVISKNLFFETINFDSVGNKMFKLK